MATTKLLYEIVYDALKAQILSGIYQEGELLPSEREIGDQHNVDRTTVRKALKMLVDDQLVVKQAGIGTKVCREGEIVQQKGSKEPTVRNNLNGNIGFFLPPSVHRTDRISQPFYSTLFYHTERECRAHGYNCLYSTLVDEHDDFSIVLQRQHFDGIIFVSNTADKFIQMSIDANIPCVLVNEYNPKLLSYLPDNMNGMIQMCDYLIGLGHRKFALITGINTYLTSQERMIGCIYSFSKNQIDPPYIATCDWEPDTAYRITKELLSTANPLPTAIIGFNDNIAIGCLRAASELGLRVPEDVSIVGFDDIEQSRYAIPAITTVHSGIKELAQATINGLLFQIANPKFNTSMRSYVPCSLVIRESTAEPSKKS